MSGKQRKRLNRLRDHRKSLREWARQGIRWRHVDWYRYRTLPLNIEGIGRIESIRWIGV